MTTLRIYLQMGLPSEFPFVSYTLGSHNVSFDIHPLNRIERQLVNFNDDRSNRDHNTMLVYHLSSAGKFNNPVGALNFLYYTQGNRCQEYLYTILLKNRLYSSRFYFQNFITLLLPSNKKKFYQHATMHD